MVKIRAAEERDTERMAELLIAAWKTAYAGIVPEDYAAGLSGLKYVGIFLENLRTGRETMLVAEEDGIVWGFAGGKLLEEGDFDCEVVGLYVHPERQGAGCGAALLRAIFDIFRSKGRRRASLWTLKGARNNAFYRKMGGAEIGERSYNFGGADCAGIGFGFDIETHR